jgi:hypothetical protein
MKSKRMNVKLTPEVADELNWQSYPPLDPKDPLDDQVKIFSEQNRRLYSMIDKGLDYIVTDSPILLTAVYLRTASKHFKVDRERWNSAFEDFCYRTFIQYDNINYYLHRGDREYIQKGRIQNKVEAEAIDVSCLYFLEWYGLPYKQINSYEDIIKDLGI